MQEEEGAYALVAWSLSLPKPQHPNPSLSSPPEQRQPEPVGAVTSRSLRVAPVGSLCCWFYRVWCDLLFVEGVPIAVVVQQSAFSLLLLLFCCSCWLRIWVGLLLSCDDVVRAPVHV
jgi:hypothetical protein